MKKLSKHLIKATSKHQSRPILNGVHFDSERNTMTATDSHRLLEWTTKDRIESSMTMNLETMTIYDNDYPNTERLFPKYGMKLKFKASQVTKDLIKDLTKHKKEMCKMTITSDSISFEIESFNKTTLEKESVKLTHIILLESSEVRSKEVVFFNPEYLRDMFDFVFDYECDKENKQSLIEVLFVDSVRPMSFCSTFFRYLITPIRTN